MGGFVVVVVGVGDDVIRWSDGAWWAWHCLSAYVGMSVIMRCMWLNDIWGVGVCACVSVCLCVCVSVCVHGCALQWKHTRTQ